MPRLDHSGVAPDRVLGHGLSLGTMQILKENWAWFLAPIVLFAAVAAFLLLSGDSAPGPYELY